MFVQIGDYAFAPEHITEVWFLPATDTVAEHVIVDFDVAYDDEVSAHRFIGEDNDGFRFWWKYNATVHKV